MGVRGCEQRVGSGVSVAAADANTAFVICANAGYWSEKNAAACHSSV